MVSPSVGPTASPSAPAPASPTEETTTNLQEGQLTVNPPDSPKRLEVLSLSGGGMRAAFFHLGVLSYLELAGELQNVRLIVSVSGGSIISAHFLKNWARLRTGSDGFTEVSAELVKMASGNIRDSVLVPWLWSRLLLFTWVCERFGRTRRLQKAYERHFETTTFDDLLRQPNVPQAAIAANDSRRQERILFTKANVLRFSYQGTPLPSILSQGTTLAFAVAASSCFPPVFPRMHITYKDLGLTYAEFRDALYLNDGGVTSNLGIEAVHALKADMPLTERGIVLVSDAECRQATEPGNSPLTDVFAQGTALSEAARTGLREVFGAAAILVPFGERVPDGKGLPFAVETRLAGYRTDLDAPSWQELHALMIHGAAACENALSSTSLTRKPLLRDVRGFVKDILTKAGAPKDLPEPSTADLKTCSRRPVGRLLVHAVLVALCFCGWAWLALAAVHWMLPKPVAELPLDEPLPYQLLPDPTKEPGFPSRAQVQEASNRSISGTLFLYRNVSPHNARLLVYDCAMYYAGGGADDEFVRAFFSEWPVAANAPSNGGYERFSRFRKTQNWVGFYCCDLVTHTVTLIGFYDLTTHRQWQLDISHAGGGLKGDVTHD